MINNIGLIMANAAIHNTITQAQTINMMSHHHHNNTHAIEGKKESDNEKLKRLKTKAKYIPKHLNKKDLIKFLESQEEEELNMLSI